LEPALSGVEWVIRAFVKMREQLAPNSAILKRLAEIDKTLIVHDSARACQETDRLPSLISKE